MNPANKSRPDAPTPADNITDLDDAGGGAGTPVADMQPEDAGTPESGNTRGNAADDESEPGRKAGSEKANKR
jgi:hypothetical protein